MSRGIRYAVFGGIAIVAIVGLTIFLLSDSGSSRSGDGGEGAARKDRFGFGDFSLTGSSDPEQILKDYRAYAVYPPTSRPLKRDMTDLTSPNGRYEGFLPVSTPPSDKSEEARRNRRKPEHYYLFTGDRYFVVGEESIRIHLRAAERASLNADRVPIRVVEAALYRGQSHLDFKQNKIADLRLNDDGLDGDEKQGDHIYSVEIRPSQMAALARFHGRCQVYAKFVVGNLEIEGLIPFEYQPASEIPARFTGNFSDVQEDGSLIVMAEVDVVKPGYFIFDANLFDSLDTPVAYTRTKVELKKRGPQEVKFVFFGRVIRDQSPQPPFRVRNVRGRRNMLGLNPPDPAKNPEFFKNRTAYEQVIPWYQGTYQTRGSYANLAVFSDKEWDSPEKRSKLEFLKKEIESGTKMPVGVGQ